VKVPYFAYGSNMHLAQMAIRCPGARTLGLVSKRGWRFMINDRGFVTAIDDPGSEVLGCLWDLTEEHWAELDRYEGVSSGFYARVKCKVVRMDNGVIVETIAYRATCEVPGVPVAEYADTVIDGARDIGLPEEYVSLIESWRNGPPES